MRDGSEDLGGREVGDLDHVARIPGLLQLAVLFERRLEEGLAVKVVGRDVAHAVILSGTACELVHHATGAGAGSSRGRFVRTGGLLRLILGHVAVLNRLGIAGRGLDTLAHHHAEHHAQHEEDRHGSENACDEAHQACALNAEQR